MKIGRWILLAAVVAGGGYYAWHRFGSMTRVVTPVVTTGVPEVTAPHGVRIKVEVLNATRTKGLARRATTYLRDRGFDVVETGTSTKQLEKTIVIDRSNHAEWARLVAMVFGADVQEKPDSLKFLDVTVLLGADWRPPALPFYP
ncbi:MAG: LytR C-terminal domain-containing protein [Gemmatimonadaceae bacterium]